MFGRTKISLQCCGIKINKHIVLHYSMNSTDWYLYLYCFYHNAAFWSMGESDSAYVMIYTSIGYLCMNQYFCPRSKYSFLCALSSIKVSLSGTSAKYQSVTPQLSEGDPSIITPPPFLPSLPPLPLWHMYKIITKL